MSVQALDLRVRRTHSLLWEALMAELSERAFEEITVKDICERAMVHRTTFYKHYDGKEALLKQGLRQMYDVLMAEEEHMPPSAFSVEHPPTYIVRLFEHAAHHRGFYRQMLREERLGMFQRLLKDYIIEVASRKARTPSSNTRALAVPLAMHAQFAAGAIVGLLAWWLENDMPLSPHRMAQYLLSPHETSPARA